MLQFRLVYRGRLPAQSPDDNRNKAKQLIRTAFHPQLDTLLRNHPTLRMLNVNRATMMERDIKEVAGVRFFPMVAQDETCELSVLFLRRDGPGNLVKHGGDIDNRMKVLLDALRRPQEPQEVLDPKPTENPFFCVLDDDKLITTLNITTDFLLTPMEDRESVNDVHLVIHVISRPRNYITA